MSMLLLAVAASIVVPPTRIVLAFAPVRAVPATVQCVAVAEAAVLWAAAGVVIEPLDASGRATSDAVVLTVVVTSSTSTVAARRTDAALGAIVFGDDGTPGHVITVFFDRLVRLLNDTLFGDVPLFMRQRETREPAIGRALGRIIAHEIGHFVLRSKRHARHGLMSAVYRADDLVLPGRHPYLLSR